MDRTMDSQLEDIKKLVLTMGTHVEQALELATRALVKRHPDEFQEVHQIEEKINQAHVAVDNSCVLFLAKQGPVAKDLRFVVSLIKINADLERMGDQAVNIAHYGKDYLSRADLQMPPEIEKMSYLVRKMVRGSLDSFVREDGKLAQEILLMDDEVDGLKRTVNQKMIEVMKAHSGQVEGALELILVARNLERLGDHATNIAEDVIFVSTGEDVRHGGKFS